MSLLLMLIFAPFSSRVLLFSFLNFLFFIVVYMTNEQQYKMCIKKMHILSRVIENHEYTILPSFSFLIKIIMSIINMYKF